MRLSTHVAGRLAGLSAQALDREFRAGQIVQVFDLDFRQHHLSLEVVGKLFQLLADFGNSFQIFALLPLRYRH